MSGVTLDLASQELENTTKKLAGFGKSAERAVKDALHRAGDGLKTDAVNETTRKYHLSAGEIRKHLLFKKGGRSGYHSVALIAKGSRKRLSEYKVTGRGGNIRVAVKREGGMKALRTGFVIDNNGRKIVLWRPDAAKSRRVMGPSVPQLIRNQDTVKAIEKGAVQRYKKRLDSNIERLLRGSWKG